MPPTGRGDSDPNRRGSHRGGSSRNEGRGLSGESHSAAILLASAQGLTRGPRPFTLASQTVDMRSKSAVFSDDKRDGRAGEIRTRGLLVPNRTCRPTVFDSILARLTQRRASLLT